MRALSAQLKALEGTTAQSFDPFDLVCPGSECTKRLSGQWAFRDNSHLSVAMSSELADDLFRLFPRTNVATGTSRPAPP